MASPAAPAAPTAPAGPTALAAPTAPTDQPRIEADPDLVGNDSDSTLGDDVSKYTASLTSSIQAYPMENGRRYHAFKDGSYVMPNDDSELDRLDLIHQMCRITLGEKNYLAPIGDNPGKVLDIGTGTGIWAIEFGDDHPSAEIIGTDLSPTQPTWVPANVKFEVDDCEAQWTWPTPFDFIHSRYLAGSVLDWPKLIGQAFANTKPGGWVEFQDYDFRYYSEDDSYTPELSICKWVTRLLDACVDFGRDGCPGPKLEKMLKDAGFQNVVAQRFRIPIGPWPRDKHLKTIGSWNLVQIEEGLEGLTLRLYTQLLKWQPEEVQVLLADVRKNLRDPRIHSQYDYYVVYGQRPEEAGASEE